MLLYANEAPRFQQRAQRLKVRLVTQALVFLTDVDIYLLELKTRHAYVIHLYLTTMFPNQLQQIPSWISAIVHAHEHVQAIIMSQCSLLMAQNMWHIQNLLLQIH